MFWTEKPSIRDRELAALKELYARVRHQSLDTSEVVSLMGGVFAALEPRLAEPVNKALGQIIEQEHLTGPEPDFDALDLKQKLFLSHRLKALELKLSDTGASDLLAGIFGSLAVELPKTSEPSPFTVPLINTLQNPAEWISRVYKTLHEDRYYDREILKTLREQMYFNLCHASDIEPLKETKKSFKHAVSSDLPLGRLNDVYLDKTPFHELFKTPVPLRLTHEDRFSHMWILGGSGAGKTSLIETLLLYDLRAEDPPSIVLIEPHSDLVRKLARADLGISDRIIVIDPRDIKHPPALNIFALNQERMASYDEVTREQVTAGVIETYEYLFSGLGIDLTGKQSVLFRNVCRLLIALPQSMGRNATILDMLKIMSDATPYRAAIDNLADIPREFFEKDFNQTTFSQTKEQIRYRLQALLENPVMARLLTSPETKLDLFTEMNQGAVILVDTADSFLKSASADYGRFFISLIQQAVLERSAIAAKNRKPTFIYIDEAATYFSTNIDDLLTEARKYKVGMILSHHYMGQASIPLRGSLAANTGIKFASGVSAADARSMASDMRTTGEFILNQPTLQFAAYIRNVTPHAISIPIRFGTIDRLEKLSPDDYDALIERNRARVSLSPEPEQPVSPEPPPVGPREW